MFSEPTFSDAVLMVHQQAEGLHDVFNVHLQASDWGAALVALDKLEQFWQGVTLDDCQDARRLALEVFIPRQRRRTLLFQADPNWWRGLTQEAYNALVSGQS